MEASSKPLYKRVLLKISGEALMGEQSYGLDIDTVERICSEIKEAYHFGVASKNQKEFMKDLKEVYQASNKDNVECHLLKLEEKWGEKYPMVIKSWQSNRSI